MRGQFPSLSPLEFTPEGASPSGQGFSGARFLLPKLEQPAASRELPRDSSRRPITSRGVPSSQRLRIPWYPILGDSSVRGSLPAGNRRRNRPNRALPAVRSQLHPGFPRSSSLGQSGGSPCGHYRQQDGATTLGSNLVDGYRPLFPRLVTWKGEPLLWCVNLGLTGFGSVNQQRRELLAEAEKLGLLGRGHATIGRHMFPARCHNREPARSWFSTSQSGRIGLESALGLEPRPSTNAEGPSRRCNKRWSGSGSCRSETMPRASATCWKVPGKSAECAIFSC